MFLDSLTQAINEGLINILLRTNDQTASIINSPNAQNDIFFSNSIEYQNQKYRIIEIGETIKK